MRRKDNRLLPLPLSGGWGCWGLELGSVWISHSAKEMCTPWIASIFQVEKYTQSTQFMNRFEGNSSNFKQNKKILNCAQVAIKVSPAAWPDLARNRDRQTKRETERDREKQSMRFNYKRKQINFRTIEMRYIISPGWGPTKDKDEGRAVDDDDDGWPFGIGSKQARDLAVFFVAISKPNDSTSLGFALLINCSSIFNAIADLGQTTVFVFPLLLLLLLLFFVALLANGMWHATCWDFDQIRARLTYQCEWVKLWKICCRQAKVAGALVVVCWTVFTEPRNEVAAFWGSINNCFKLFW